MITNMQQMQYKQKQTKPNKKLWTKRSMLLFFKGIIEDHYGYKDIVLLSGGLCDVLDL